ncbi:MAG TPA: hypothetical protein DEV93_18770 [Chloroflexi bacterium]|nr:hypothetical protein [Chloroflexota bacterium]
MINSQRFLFGLGGVLVATVVGVAVPLSFVGWGAVPWLIGLLVLAAVGGLGLGLAGKAQVTTRIRTRTRANARGDSVAVFPLLALILLLTGKQLMVNMVAGDRHLVAAVLEVVILAAGLLGLFVVVLGASTRAQTGIKLVLIIQFALLAWWGCVALFGPGGDLEQRLVSFGYDAAFTTLIWVPFVSLKTKRHLRIAEAGGVIAILAIAAVGILQWFVTDSSLPGLLRSDATVALSGTPLGTTRVNGLIGTSIEFGLILAVGIALTFWRVSRRPSRRGLSIVAVLIVALLFSGSRAAWLSTAGGVVALSLSLGRRMIAMVLPAVVFVASALLLPSGYLTAPLQNSAPYQASDSIRLNAISTAAQDMLASPLVGTGIGFQNAPSFDRSTNEKVITDGFWWSVGLEGGFIGLALLLGWLAAVGSVFLRVVKVKEARAWAMPSLVVIGLMMFSGLVNSAIDNQSISALLYLCLGTGMAGCAFAVGRSDTRGTSHS